MTRPCKAMMWSAMLAVAVLWGAAPVQAICPESSLIENPAFEGTGGPLYGSATGSAPDGWRGFAVGGGAAAFEIVDVAAGELYPGSPATRAVRMSVLDFTGDQAFDNDQRRFVMNSALRYNAEFYIRTGNADNSPQQFRFGFPVFDGAGSFLVREPGAPINLGNNVATATSTWQRVRARTFMDVDAVYGHISFRVQNDGGDENAILIAMPGITASTIPLANPEFERTLGGFPQGPIAGLIPDDWRAFAVGGAALTTNIVDVAADELYPGSPATKAALVQVDTYGADQGFDLDIARFQMFPGVTYQASAYVRSANPDSSGQTFRMQFPIYGGPAYTRDATISPFLGREPGSTGNLTATTAWQRFTGPMFQDTAAQSGSLAFRVPNNGGAGNAILIAMPAVKPADTPNPVPNPGFAGTAGAKTGAVTGSVPDQWRAIAVTGPAGPVSAPNPGFEIDPEGTTTPGGDFINSSITGWRTFSVGGAGGKMTVTSAAGKSGKGVEIVRETAAGDSGFDLDDAALRLQLAPQSRVYRLLVSARDGGPYGGTPNLSTGFQFGTSSFNRSASFDPSDVFETYGTSAVSDTVGRLSVRIDVGAGAGRSVHIDDVQLIEVTSGVDRMVNPGFEASGSRLLGWRFFQAGATVGSATLSNDAYTGANAALLQVTDDNGEPDRDIGLDLLGNMPAARAGEQVEVRFHAKKVGAADTRLAVNIAGHASNNSLVSVIAEPRVSPPTSDYEEFVFDVVIPAGATRLNVGFRVVDADGKRMAGSYLIDDVTVTGLTPMEPFAPSAVEIVTVPVAANALFAGSPATNAVQWRQTLFGSDPALFDHLNFPMPIMRARDYNPSVYVRTANSDAADQQFDFITQLRQGASSAGTRTTGATATGTWQKVELGVLQTLSGTSGVLRFRLTADGGADDAILIAMPSAEMQPPLPGLVPNSEFAGDGGPVEGAATGEVPDRWRVFAVGGAVAETSIVPLAAGELFAGSPAVNAVTFRRTVFEGDAGLDTHLARHPLVPGTPYRVSFYARSANVDSSSQALSFGHPVFVNGTTFLQRAPGSVDATATAGWQLVEGPVFTDSAADTGHVALRLNAQSGADNAVMIALPRVDLACPTIDSVTPNQGGSTQGVVTLLVTGSNFIEGGVSVRLVRAGLPDIVGTNLMVYDTNTLEVKIDLTGAAGGERDVVICAGGACPPAILPAGFDVAGCNMPFADADGDGDVDADDFAAFQRCLTEGNAAGPFDVACSCFDRDGDLDVDHDDFVPFFLCGSGPSVPADPDCEE